MSSNKFFTVMIVPEKSNRVAKIVIPSYIFKVGNRQLRQSVQVFKTKMVTIENTLDRVKTFVTKLRIITNIEDNSGPAPSTLPAAAPHDLVPPVDPASHEKDTSSRARGPEPLDADLNDEQAMPEIEAERPANTPAKTARNGYEAQRQKRLILLAALMNESPETFTLTDADTSLFVKTEFEKLDAAHEEVNKFALDAEQETQDILERLGEKRTLLASTPTRIPTLGYITS